MGLPQSEEVESLAREVLSDPSLVFNQTSTPVSTSTFQNPLVSFAYERGWRRSFASSGFPGVEEEFRMAERLLSTDESGADNVVLDASCGSGLFSRRFAASGSCEAVVALDFSAAMLRQVDDFAQKELGKQYGEPKSDNASLTLVRADIARLPFASASFGRVHAGAAIHCWPNPENAIAEISRVLKPGGVFVLSTFRPRGQLAMLNRRFPTYRFWEDEELEQLTRQCGLVNYEAITREPAFIMVRVQKPMAA